MEVSSMYYYRIYDDTENLNFFKSSLDRKTIEQSLREFERKGDRFTNDDFVKFLKNQDKEAEIISITNVSY